MTGRVAGKVALITGAARGQGRSHAVRLAEEGADIIAIDVCRQYESAPYPMAVIDDLDETQRLVEDLDRRIYAVQADVGDREQLNSVVADAIAEFGRLDIVCANAGIASYAPSWELTGQEWDEMILVNLTGVWNTVKATVPFMIEQGEGGSLIFTSSTGALQSIPNASHYSAAKRGVVGLAKSLVQELGPHYIRVNTVHPTSVDTDMVHNEHTYGIFMPGGKGTKEEAMPLFAATNAIPVPWVDSRDISNAVLFLASEEARFVSGCQLTVDAGATSKYPGT